MRASNGPATKARRNRVRKRAKGFVGRRKLFRGAKETTLRAEAFAFAHRRTRKREFRALWITRLSAAAQQHDLLYSRFIHGVQKAGIALNRKELSELAIHDPAMFGQICEQAKAALAQA